MIDVLFYVFAYTVLGLIIMNILAVVDTIRTKGTICLKDVEDFWKTEESLIMFFLWPLAILIGIFALFKFWVFDPYFKEAYLKIREVQLYETKSARTKRILYDKKKDDSDE